MGVHQAANRTPAQGSPTGSLRRAGLMRKDLIVRGIAVRLAMIERVRGRFLANLGAGSTLLAPTLGLRTQQRALLADVSRT